MTVTTTQEKTAPAPTYRQLEQQLAELKQTLRNVISSSTFTNNHHKARIAALKEEKAVLAEEKVALQRRVQDEAHKFAQEQVLSRNLYEPARWAWENKAAVENDRRELDYLRKHSFIQEKELDLAEAKTRQAEKALSQSKKQRQADLAEMQRLSALVEEGKKEKEAMEEELARLRAGTPTSSDEERSVSRSRSLVSRGGHIGFDSWTK